MTLKENLANTCIFAVLPITWGLALREHSDNLRGEYTIDGETRTVIGLGAMGVDLATHAGSVALLLHGKIVEGILLEVIHNIAGMLPKLPDALRAVRRYCLPTGNGTAVI